MNQPSTTPHPGASTPAEPASGAPRSPPSPEVVARMAYLFRLCSQTPAGAVLQRALARFHTQEQQP